jgi:hypothetical protein
MENLSNVSVVSMLDIKVSYVEHLMRRVLAMIKISQRPIVQNSS